MSTQKSKSKDSEKKSGMDPEVTRVVLIFLLLLVIIALLVAAFMSLGGGSDQESQDNIIQIEMPTDENGEQISTEEIPVTDDPNHHASTETIPLEVLNPDGTTELDMAEGDVPGNPMETGIGTVAVATDEAGNLMETQATPGNGDSVVMTTTSPRPANTNPVYVSTAAATDSLATLAPPLTTAGDGSTPTTLTTTIGDNAGDGQVSSVNYTVSLSGSAGIYAEPGGSSNGTIGSNGTFTIIQEKTDANGIKWGKLKSGAGWVRLN